MSKPTARPKLIYVVPILAIALLCVMMLMPLPDLGYLFGSLVNFMHIPLFAGLAFCTWVLTGPTLVQRPILKALVVWGIVGVIGVVFEVLQSNSGRSASLHDILANLLGSGIMLSFLLSTLVEKSTASLWRMATCIGLLVAIYTPLMEVYDVFRMRADFPRIADFESGHELHRWRFGNAHFQRSTHFAIDSRYSLQVTFDPARFSGVWIPYSVPDWSEYSRLILHVHVPPENESVPLLVKLEDSHHNDTPEDRFVREFDLKPGSHRLEIELDEVKLADREFDFTEVTRFQLMVWEQTVPHEIFVDAIHLE